MPSHQTRKSLTHKLSLKFCWVAFLLFNPTSAFGTPPVTAPVDDVEALLKPHCISVTSLHKGKTFSIKAKVNGKEGLFLIDSGSNANLLSAASVKKFGLETTKSKVTATGVGGGMQLVRVNVDELTLTEKTTLKKPVFFTGNGWSHREFDGIIGIRLLRSARAILDLSEWKIHFMKPGSEEAVANLMKGIPNTQRLPVVFHDRTGHPLIKGTVNGVDATLMLDAASAETIIFQERTERYKVKLIPSGVKVHGGNQKTSESMVFSADRLSLGDFSVRKLPILALDGSNIPFNGPRTKTPVDGILGMNVMGSAPLLFDVKNRFLYVPKKEVLGINLGAVAGVLPFTEKQLQTLAADYTVISEVFVKEAKMVPENPSIIRLTLRTGEIYHAKEKKSVAEVQMDITKEKIATIKPPALELKEFLSHRFIYFQKADGSQQILPNGALRLKQLEALKKNTK